MFNYIDRDVINVLIVGYFVDFFFVFGMYCIDVGLEVCVLLFDVIDVWVIELKIGCKVGKFECFDLCGFFSGVLLWCKNVFCYQLVVIWYGQQNLIDDFYCFGLLLQDFDVWLLLEGIYLCFYEMLGVYVVIMDGVIGICFLVWVLNVCCVLVVGQFNYWDGCCYLMWFCKEFGIWELFVFGVYNGQLYKFELIDVYGNLWVKVDFYVFEL